MRVAANIMTDASSLRASQAETMEDSIWWQEAALQPISGTCACEFCLPVRYLAATEWLLIFQLESAASDSQGRHWHYPARFEVVALDLWKTGPVEWRSFAYAVGSRPRKDFHLLQFHGGQLGLFLWNEQGSTMFNPDLPQPSGLLKPLGFDTLYGTWPKCSPGLCLHFRWWWPQLAYFDRFCTSSRRSGTLAWRSRMWVAGLGFIKQFCCWF